MWESFVVWAPLFFLRLSEASSTALKFPSKTIGDLLEAQYTGIVEWENRSLVSL